MSLIIPANSAAAATGFNVANSCRFNDGSSDYLSRSNGTPTSLRKYTFSAWVKKTSTAGSLHTLYSNGTNGDNYMFIHFRQDTEQLTYADIKSGQYQVNLRTNRVFRDSSAWYHVMIAVDTTQGTNTNRVKMYINGVQETSFHTATYPDQNDDLVLNGSNTNIGRYTIETDRYFDGYMSEVVFVDGTQQANTDLGEFDEDSGIWKPIDVSGLTFGDNGYYLDFENSGALGADVSGESNNFTVNNLTAIDQSTDTCTNNFCTINPLVNGTQRNPTLSEGNTFLTNTSGAWKNCLSSFAASSGKWYFEIKPTLHGTSYVHAGIFPVDDWQNQVSGYPNFGGTANSWSYDSDGNIVNNDGNANTSPATYTTNDIIGIAVDLDNNKFYAYKNNALQVAGGTSINANIEYYFGGMGYNSNIAFNFGNPSYANTSDAADGNGYGAFEFAPPSGYYALNTKNLAEYG